MGAKKTTVWLTEAAARICGGEISGRINTIVGSRYDALVRACLPVLTDGEWCAVMDANNGTIMDDDAAIGGGYGPGALRSGMWANVADTPGLGEKWSIDALALTQKMQLWTEAQAVAAAEAVQTFWMHCDLDTPAALDLSLRRNSKTISSTGL